MSTGLNGDFTVPLVSLPCVFMRGGTSKGLIFKREELPADQSQWDLIFLAVLGSPDPYERQLDGMGGGISSLSKICVVSTPSRADADVDYTFAQVSVKGSEVDYSGNCGNMSSAIGPFAAQEGLVTLPRDGAAMVRIHNTNTGKIIHAHFDMADGQPVVDGTFELDGVAGRSAPIRLDFIDPAGSKTGALLPTGHAREILDVPDLGAIEVSLVDAANPNVFIRAADIGLPGDALPSEIAANNALLAKLEAIRCAASVRMGLTRTPEEAADVIGIPKIVMLSAMLAENATISGRTLAAADADVLTRTISVGQPHKAIPLTGALCLAAAIRTPGTLAHELARRAYDDARITIAHPSGTIEVDAETRQDGERLTLPRASVYRSARRLLDGRVHYRGFADA